MKAYTPVFEFNDWSKELDMICPATIYKMPKKPRTLKNDNATEYYQAVTLVHMPDGSELKTSTTIWGAIEDSTGFEKGDELDVAFQTKGKYKGFSKIYLGKQDKASALSKYDSALAQAYVDRDGNSEPKVKKAKKKDKA